MAKMKTNHKHYSAGAVIWIVIKYFSLVFFSFVALLPIVSCVITAFKTDAEYQSTNVMTLPESWLNFQNFIDAFNRANMGRAYLNSAIILVFVLLGSVLVGTQLAYVLNRFKFPGNGLIRSQSRDLKETVDKDYCECGMPIENKSINVFRASRNRKKHPVTINVST